jgi:excisionase family DNA binding protein
MHHLRTEEAAKRLNVKPETLEAWRCRGGGPAFLKLGKAVRYRESDLDAYEASRLRQNTSERNDRG